MGFFMQFLNIFHVLVAIALVAFVLIQKGQGATAGAAFGSGASGTVFGARGAGNFLSRTTWVLAALFCAISLTMAVVVSRTVQVPENDLGVVGSTQPAAEVTTSEQNSEISVSSDQSTGTDLPALEPSADSLNEQRQLIEEAVDDLPGLDSVLTDEAPAVDDQAAGDDPDSGDN
jgi:preprotein translocase subunit SecG